MKKIIYQSIGLMLAGMVYSCSGQNETSGNRQINVDEALARADAASKADPDASGGNTCLLAYAEKYDQLLTADMVLQATGFEADKMEEQYNKVLKNPAQHSIIYRFDHNRVGPVMGLDRPMAQKDVITLSYIKACTPKHFKDSYRALTEEENKVVDEVTKDVVEGRSDDPEARAAVEKLEKQGVSKKTLSKTTEVLKGAFRKVAEGYRTVPDMGDDARWNVVTNELVVLQNGVQFVLTVNVDNDVEKNKQLAMVLARKILSRCD